MSVTDTEVRPITDVQEAHGLMQARRIINQSAGFYFGGQLTPFAEQFKELAIRAIDSITHRMQFADMTIRNAAYLISSIMEGKTEVESYIAGYRILFNYIYPTDKPREHVDNCELLNEKDLNDIKDILMGESSMVGSRYNELKEKLDLTTHYAKKFQKFTQLEIK